MTSYDDIRQTYKPEVINYLLIAESPPPAAGVKSSRQFYRAEYQAPDDRLYANTMRALFEEADKLESKDLEAAKEHWLQQFKAAGYYMIEALEQSQVHEVTKKQRQERLGDHVDLIIQRVGKLASPDTKIILIKSNVFVILAEPLREAGFKVLNHELLDYPGQYNQRDYREKLKTLISL